MTDGHKKRDIGHVVGMTVPGATGSIVDPETVDPSADPFAILDTSAGMPIALPTTPTVVLMIGASGAGKSTLAARLVDTRAGSAVVSLDTLRARFGAHAGDQSATPNAVAEALNLLHRRSRGRLTTILDATSTEAEHRRAVAAIGAHHRLPVLAIVLDTPLDLCLYRQRSRPAHRRVPADGVRAQHAAVRAALPVLPAEGYAGVHILRPLAPHPHQPEPAEVAR